jgi:hypothetical protein
MKYSNINIFIGIIFFLFFVYFYINEKFVTDNIKIYQNPHYITSDTKYIGCYKDQQHRRAFLRALNTSPSMSFQQCKESAQNIHDKYFSLQHGFDGKAYCYTGPKNTEYYKYGSVNNCPLDGGEFTNQIYELIK